MKRKVLVPSLMILIWNLASVQMAFADTGSNLFDGRAWTIGNHQQSRTRSQTEYILPGQSVDHWKELVTSTVFIDSNHVVPLAKLVDQIHLSLTAGCPSLVWNIVRQDDKTVIFEWHDAGCGGFAPQSEIDRIAIGSQGTYRLAYAAYVTGGLAPEQRESWLDILGRVPLVEASAESAAPGSPAPPHTARPNKGEIETASLTYEVYKSGQNCAAGGSSESLPAAGEIKKWKLLCSDGNKYTVLLDPSGAVTVLKISR